MISIMSLVRRIQRCDVVNILNSISAIVRTHQGWIIEPDRTIIHPWYTHTSYIYPYVYIRSYLLYDRTSTLSAKSDLATSFDRQLTALHMLQRATLQIVYAISDTRVNNYPPLI